MAFQIHKTISKCIVVDESVRILVQGVQMWLRTHVWKSVGLDYISTYVVFTQRNIIQTKYINTGCI
jgi:hypothetical protein